MKHSTDDDLSRYHIVQPHKYVFERRVDYPSVNMMASYGLSVGKVQMSNNRKVLHANPHHVSPQKKPQPVPVKNDRNRIHKMFAIIQDRKENINPKPTEKERAKTHNVVDEKQSIILPVKSNSSDEVRNIPKYGYEGMPAPPPKEEPIEEVEEEIQFEVIPSQILCRYNKMRETIPLRDNGFGLVEIVNTFAWDDKQVLFWNVKGIKQTTGAKKFYPFVCEPTLYSIPSLDAKCLSSLSDQMEYEIITEDLRVKQIDGLTQTEMYTLRMQFKEMDKLRLGYLMEDDIADYFEMKRHDLIMNARKQYKADEFLSPELKRELEHRIHYLDRFFAAKSEAMITRSQEKQGKIEWEDFIFFNGVDVIKARPS